MIVIIVLAIENAIAVVVAEAPAIPWTKIVLIQVLTSRRYDGFIRLSSPSCIPKHSLPELPCKFSITPKLELKSEKKNKKGRNLHPSKSKLPLDEEERN